MYMLNHSKLNFVRSILIRILFMHSQLCRAFDYMYNLNTVTKAFSPGNCNTKTVLGVFSEKEGVGGNVLLCGIIVWKCGSVEVWRWRCVEVWKT